MPGAQSALPGTELCTEAQPASELNAAGRPLKTNSLLPHNGDELSAPLVC